MRACGHPDGASRVEVRDGLPVSGCWACSVEKEVKSVAPDPLPGYKWQAVEDGDWSAIARHPRCRARDCVETPVATLFRGRRRIPYSYCPAHMYGRWVQDGRVLEWVLRPVAA